MFEYGLILALTYFKEKNDEYIISELAGILGYTHTQIDKLIEELISMGYVAYIDELIHITPKGITFLIANEMENLRLLDDDFKLIHIRPEDAVDIEEPYVPTGFAKKYDG